MESSAAYIARVTKKWGAAPRMALQLLDQVEGLDAAKQTNSEDGSSVVHLSITSGNLELLELLLERGCDADATDLKGRTPLSLACGRGGLDFVKMLVEHGAAMHKTTRECTWQVEEEGKVKSMVVEYIQPLAYALLNDHTEIVTYLLEQGARANSTTLAVAITKGLDTFKVCWRHMEKQRQRIAVYGRVISHGLVVG
jgi:ankyrin repeat protein